MQNALWANKIEAYRTFRDSGLSYRHFATKRFRVFGGVTPSAACKISNARLRRLAAFPSCGSRPSTRSTSGIQTTS